LKILKIRGLDPRKLWQILSFISTSTEMTSNSLILWQHKLSVKSQSYFIVFTFIINPTKLIDIWKLVSKLITYVWHMKPFKIFIFTLLIIGSTIKQILYLSTLKKIVKVSDWTTNILLKLGERNSDIFFFLKLYCEIIINRAF
jgi:hypothetical protein